MNRVQPVQFQTGAAFDTPHLSQPISYRYSIAAQRRAAWIDPRRKERAMKVYSVAWNS